VVSPENHTPPSSSRAQDIVRSSAVIDLHFDTFIWQRLFGYDFRKPHRQNWIGGNLFGQLDLPRLKSAGFSGGVWSITTNPFRFQKNRGEVFQKNLTALKKKFRQTEGSDHEVVHVRSASDFITAQKAGKHAAWIGVQGGNAFDSDLSLLEKIGSDLVKVTILHLLDSPLGRTSTPLPKIFRSRLSASSPNGLTGLGRDLVRALNENRIFVDLAHISREGFWDAVKVHDPRQPLLVSHTGVCGVYPHWRNIDDDQLRAVAKTEGTVGVIFEKSFLEKSSARHHASIVIDHLEHIIRTIGEDYASLGSDWDGLITPPKELKSCDGVTALVSLMLERGWSTLRIQKILGGNFLRALTRLKNE
jgi:membrane dipeptidase